MKKEILPFILLLLLVGAIAQNTKAQTNYSHVIGSAGKQISGTTMSMTFTVGEPVINIISGTNAELNQGFQQDYPSTILTAIEQSQALNANANIKLMPNPSTDVTRLMFETATSIQDYVLTMYDINGKMVQSGFIPSGQSYYEINLMNLNNGMYFIHLNGTTNHSINTFKLIKN
jgi:hypothetical protein